MSTRQAAMRRTRNTAVLVASLLLIIGLVAWIAITRGSSASDFEGAGNGEEQVVQIQDGASLSELGPELADRGIVASDNAFQTAAANNPNADNIQPGFYRLQGEMSAESAVNALLDPQQRVTPLQVYGGATLMDINILGGQTRLGILSMIQQSACGEKPAADCVNLEDRTGV